MAFFNIYADYTGQVGEITRHAYILTDADLATVTTADWLTLTEDGQQLVQPDGSLTDVILTQLDVIECRYNYNELTGASDYAELTASISGQSITLNQNISPGNVVLPTTANKLAVFTDANGQIGDADGVEAVHLNSIKAGANGVFGSFIAFPTAANSGSVRYRANSNSGDYQIIVGNDSMGQATTLTFPDPGTATAKFLLDTGAANILNDNQEFFGLSSIIAKSVGTWTDTRVSAGVYATVKSAADETAIIGIDITDAIRTTASKGKMVTSFDVVFSIGTADLDAHSAALYETIYADTTPITTNNIGLTGSLSFSTNANPQVNALSIASPGFENNARSKYTVEVTVDAAATSVYSFYGIILHFDETIA